MSGFADKKSIAELTAKMLIEVEAVRFMADKPFIFTSGWASPVYTDCRRLISFPRVRRTLIDFGAATIERDAGFADKRRVALRPVHHPDQVDEGMVQMANLFVHDAVLCV